MNALFNWDTQIFLKINGYVGTWLDYFLGWPTYLGEAYFFLPIIFLFMLIWESPKKIIPRFTLIIFCVLLAGIANRVLKEIIDRPRPYAFFYQAIDQGKVIVHYLFKIETSKSFPSGHTANVFGLAMIFCCIYGKRAAWIYLFALWIGITRIYVGAHFPLDVLGGALVGMLSAAIGFWLFRKFLSRIPFFSANPL